MGWELSTGNIAEIASQWIRDKIMTGSGWALTMVTFGQAQKFCTYSEEAVYKCHSSVQKATQLPVLSQCCPQSLSDTSLSPVVQ